MILQQILFGVTEDLPLYYRGTSVEWCRDRLVFDRSAMVSTNTYFNAFSIGKWQRYCVLGKLSLLIELKGQFFIKVIHAQKKGASLSQRVLEERTTTADIRQSVTIPLDCTRDGVVFFSLQALEKGAELYRAWYESEMSSAQTDKEITLALNICTYKRETQLLQNLALLRQKILQNTESPLYGHIKVFVTDNDSSLDVRALSGKNIYVCHNPNVGGAGGFTRGLLEISKRAAKEKITHIIFMDDDIEILPESLIRTFRMLKILKPVYQNAFIAGAMLRQDRHSVQHENGARWNAGNCVFINRGLDLSSFRNVVWNENAQDADYAAWWYCCIPVSMVRRDNLPLPVFIHGDDVEYSLRCADHIITMNGIAVRHPVAEHRRISANEYYNLRNMLIINALYVSSYTKRQVSKKVFMNMLMALLRYRYRDMKLAYMGLRDFCRGPDWLFALDAAAYHQYIVKEGYQLQDMADYANQCIHGKSGHETEKNTLREIWQTARRERTVWKLFFQVMTLNGWLLPAKKQTYVFPMNVHPVDLFRTGIILLYDSASGQGIERKRSFCQIFVFLWLYVKALIWIVFRYEKSKKAYQKNNRKLHSLKYWKKVLCKVRRLRVIKSSEKISL